LTPDLVVLGNLLVDDVVFADGTMRMGEPGGAIVHLALGARLWETRVGAASVVGEDYPAWALDALAERDVALEGLRRIEGPGLRTWLLYEERCRQVVHRLDRPSHADVSPRPAELPPAWRAARAFHLAPMPFAVQVELVDALSSCGGMLSLDPCLPLRNDTLADWRELLARVDVCFLSDDELQLDLGPPPAAARRLASGRLRYLFFKQAARGGAAYDVREDRLVPWTARARRVVDATGAGDAFAAGVLTGLLRGETLERAVERGIVGASFVLEDWGPRGLLAATPAQAEARLREWFGA
jgi:sugar/nucleoside kinase (ribokinase family)